MSLVAGFTEVFYELSNIFQPLLATIQGKFTSLSEGGDATRHLHLQGCAPWFKQSFRSSETNSVGCTKWAATGYK